MELDIDATISPPVFVAPERATCAQAIGKATADAAHVQQTAFDQALPAAGVVDPRPAAVGALQAAMRPLPSSPPEQSEVALG